MSHRRSPAKPHRDWRENAKFVANIVNRLAIPLLTVAATAVGLYATNTLKEREIAIATENNSQSLRNQREESETNLRSAMFRELVGPLLQSETEQLAKGRPRRPAARPAPRAAGRTAGAQFPRTLRARPTAALCRHAARADRGGATRLRSTSRRVISRQLAPLLSSATSASRQHPAFLEISLNSDGTEAVDKALSCAVPEGSAAPEAGSLTLQCSSSALGGPLRIVSPDGQDSLQVNVRAVSWAAQTVGIYSVLLGPKANRRRTRRRSSSRCRRTRSRSRTTRCCRAAIASAST